MSSFKKRCDRSGRGFCVPQQVIGLIMILMGILLLVLFVPFETWLAILGVALIAGGIALRML